KARHVTLHRLVAIKMILSGPHAGREAAERFIAEAKAVAKLQHPGIVQIFDIGEHSGQPWFSLEFVEGTDLQKELARKPRTAKEAAQILRDLCMAMQAAHNKGILHRDLKPANVLISTAGVLKITDFGLAKELDAEGSARTSEGTLMGTPSYMPPEQARGEMSRLDQRSDVYALGAILYHILTGRPPFLTDSPIKTVMQVIKNEPVA
ncbi:MAG: serine/threonine-protein kinase, partial [Planctomyces sp.]